MSSDRNQYNEDERIYTTMLDSAGNSLTGSTSVLLTIRRDSDGYIFDFSSKTFKASGWTTSSQPMTELDSTSNAGTYYYDLDTTFGIFGSQQNYLLRASTTSASNSPAEGYLKLGGWIDSVGLVGSGGGGMTGEQAQDIAEKVWKVILKGKKTAKEVLLSKSEFDATKDYVLTKTDLKLAELIKNTIEEIKIPEQKDYSEKIIKAINSLKPIDFNPILKKVLDKIELTVTFFQQGKYDIIKSVESQEKYDDSGMKGMMEECKTMISMMSEDMCERIEAHKMISEEIKHKEEESGEEHKEKMAEMMSKLESQAEENKKNIKKILLKMTELKFDSDNSNITDFEYIKDQLELVLDRLDYK